MPILVWSFVAIVSEFLNVSWAKREVKSEKIKKVFN